MTTSLAAMCWAAHKQGMTYGQFVSGMSGRLDETAIQLAYEADQQRLLRERVAEAKKWTIWEKPVTIKVGRPPKLDTKEVARLYDLGLNDAEIGRQTGYKPITICHWRRRTGRPPNAKQGYNEKAAPGGANTESGRNQAEA